MPFEDLVKMKNLSIKKDQLMTETESISQVT